MKFIVPQDNTKSVELPAESVFLRACRRERTDYTPIWIMRQAGRYLPEYRELRSKHSFLQMCKTPELAAQVTLMPVNRFELDAAIIFSDILLIAEAMGVGLEFHEGKGPVLTGLIRNRNDVDKLRKVDAAELSFVYEAVSMVRKALKPDVSLIGFCGAPFTLASYMIEGGSKGGFEQTRALMHSDPGAWHALMEKLGASLAGYLNGQIAAGAQAVQLFDSWVGCLDEAEYREFVFEHIEQLIRSVNPKVPIIYFGTETAELLKVINGLSAGVIGVDWRVDLGRAWKTIGYDKAIQGNLDPEILLSTPGEVRQQAYAILDRAEGRPGHIFNLGHGILPQTPIDNVSALVEVVHEYRRA